MNILRSRTIAAKRLGCQCFYAVPNQTPIKPVENEKPINNVNKLRQQLLQSKQKFQQHITQHPANTTPQQHNNSDIAEQQITEIPGQTIRTLRHGPIDLKSKPSDYMRQLMLLIHPDVLNSTTNNDTVTVIKRINNNGTVQYIECTESIENIKALNQTNLAMLNAILDYNKQFEKPQHSDNHMKPVKPPVRQNMQFYYVDNVNDTIRLIQAYYKPPSKLHSKSNDIPSVLIQDSIEGMIYSLLKLVHTDISDELIKHWKHQWYKHKVQYGYIKSNNIDTTSIYNISLKHNGVTQQKLREQQFLAEYREHRSSVLPPNDSKYNVETDYDIQQWAARRPRYTICSMMAQADLIEFDRRLTPEQCTYAIKNLQQIITEHYTKLKTAQWTGIGICFVPTQSAHNIDTSAMNDTDTPLIATIMKQSKQMYNVEWDFVRRPGWWLLPYTFDAEQLQKFVDLFLHATTDVVPDAIEANTTNSQQLRS